MIAPKQPPQSADSDSVTQEEPSRNPQIVEVDELEAVAEPTPREKRAWVEAETSTLPGPSSSDDVWAPKLRVGQRPITTQDSVLDALNIDHAARVAHVLTAGAYLPADLQACEDMATRKLFRNISRGIAMVSSFFIFLFYLWVFKVVSWQFPIFPF